MAIDDEDYYGLNYNIEPAEPILCIYLHANLNIEPKSVIFSCCFLTYITITKLQQITIVQR